MFGAGLTCVESKQLSGGIWDPKLYQLSTCPGGEGGKHLSLRYPRAWRALGCVELPQILFRHASWDVAPSAPSAPTAKGCELNVFLMTISTSLSPHSCVSHISSCSYLFPPAPPEVRGTRLKSFEQNIHLIPPTIQKCLKRLRWSWGGNPASQGLALRGRGI